MVAGNRGITAGRPRRYRRAGVSAAPLNHSSRLDASICHTLRQSFNPWLSRRVASAPRDGTALPMCVSLGNLRRRRLYLVGILGRREGEKAGEPRGMATSGVTHLGRWPSLRRRRDFRRREGVRLTPSATCSLGDRLRSGPRTSGRCRLTEAQARPGQEEDGPPSYVCFSESVSLRSACCLP